MSSTWVSLAAADVRRVLFSRRWLGVFGVWFLVWFLMVYFRFNVTAHVERSGWDIYLASMNNWMTVGYLLLPGFIFLVGDLAAEDIRRGYSWLVVSRSSRIRWWTAKIVALLVLALVYQGGFIFATLVYGAVMGLGPGAPNSGAGQTGLYPPLASPAELPGRVAHLAIYEGVAFCALAALAVVLTLVWRKSLLPLGVVVTVEILDWVLSQRSGLVRLVSPGRRLLEGVHISSTVWGTAESWQSSWLYFGVALLVVAGLGSLYVRRMDF